MLKINTKCQICNKSLAGLGNLSRHISSKHDIKLDDYIIKYYTCNDSNEIIENCGNCNNNAKFQYIIDDTNMSFSRKYINNSYFCGTLDCMNDLSLKIFKTEYNKKTFEHIGAKKEYISIVKKISIDNAVQIKFNKNRIYKEESKTNLSGYISRLGEEFGTIKYNERCNKIGLANTIQWYINKYGNDIGREKYQLKLDKIRKSSLGVNKSEASNIINKYLDELNIKYIEEYLIIYEETKRPKIVDYYLPEYNIIIEFFGSFWHCNPKIYNSEYYHKYLHKYAEEIWEKDKIRNKLLLNKTNGLIIILWEDSIYSNKYHIKYTKEELLEIINNNKNLNTIIYV